MSFPKIKRFAEFEHYDGVAPCLCDLHNEWVKTERLSRAKWARVLAESIKFHWTSDEHIEDARKELLRQAELDEGKGGLK